MKDIHKMIIFKVDYKNSENTLWVRFRHLYRKDVHMLREEPMKWE